MNSAEIVSHLRAKGYDANLEGEGKDLSVAFDAGEHRPRLLHQFPHAILQLPAFALDAAEAFGTLAHVVLNQKTGLGSVCVQDRDSISVNFEVPTLAYEDSLDRHIRLIQRLILEPEWNRQELLREFHSNWKMLCARAGTLNPALYCASNSEPPYSIQVKLPKKTAKDGIRSHFLGLDQQQSSNQAFKTFRQNLHWDERQVAGKALVLSLRIPEPAPTHPSELVTWYIDALTKLSGDSTDALTRFRKHPSKEFWLVFSAAITGGTTWCAIHFRSQAKAKLPITAEDCKPWSVEPLNLRSLDRETLVPRSGGLLALQDKSVLLVGCGSVGSDVAHRIASAGVGEIEISDPDQFDEENLYRHTLSVADIGFHKSSCVATDLRLKFPWIVTDGIYKRLETFSDPDELERFDLIIVAIGSPTLERVFHDFVTRNGVKTPVINTWVEAYGVGGHATLDMPNSKGCLRCAYVDPDSLARGLSSNLNFLEPNQDLTISHVGCGNQFLPYSGIAASYTATMAADLATQYLQGKMDRSSKVSWKGSAEEANRNGFKVTHRYRHFAKPLEILPLHNSECDVCGG